MAPKKWYPQGLWGKLIFNKKPKVENLVATAEHKIHLRDKINVWLMGQRGYILKHLAANKNLRLRSMMLEEK
jgi:hypothetical protein